MIKAILIDDEAKARRILEALLKEYCTDVEIVATAADVPSGVIAINQHKPDVLFLDVEMPGYTGFQLLDFFRDIDFDIVFTTAHSDYAVQAFRVSAIDFLLKPIQISELVAAVDKVKAKQGQNKERLSVLKENFKDNTVKKLALPVAEGLLFADTDTLTHLEADGAYTHFHFDDGKKVIVSKKIKEFEEALTQQSSFFRTHRSFIVNLKKIKQYVKQEGGYVLLENDLQVPLARER
ncbi:MAG TPA: LytTR family DNA-binding domain-containing protein, partial [Chitinophagales bacterium]|nr:LytTR family DNA-binding domain-containing protein [Chitinophagales bacterium]